jgi:hypothetical protein
LSVGKGAGDEPFPNHYVRWEGTRILNIQYKINEIYICGPPLSSDDIQKLIMNNNHANYMFCPTVA